MVFGGVYYEYMISNTVPMKEILRNWKEVFAQAKKAKTPLIVMDDNEPQGALISLDMLEEMRLEKVKNEALEEYRKGNTKTISTPEELEAEFREMEKEAKGR